MATTSLWRVHGYLGALLLYTENPDKTKVPIQLDDALDANALEDVIAYVERDHATHDRQLVSGLNCNPSTARQDMLAVKTQFQKHDGTIAYHGYQSFREGEVTPELAHEIGRQLAETLWADRYQVLVCTHVDKASHLHNHFVINTVSFVDGIKFHRTASDYKKMRDVSDYLCRLHKLSVVRQPQGKGKHYSQWMAEQQHKPTYASSIKSDIDRAIQASLTEREFFASLTTLGYTVKRFGQYGAPLKRPSLKAKDGERFRRFDRLGDGYSMEEISMRILQNDRRAPLFLPLDTDKSAQYRATHPPHTKAKGLQALYYYYCYELGILQRFSNTHGISHHLRKDLCMLDKLDEQSRFLSQHRITSIQELADYRADTTAQIEEITARRAGRHRQLRQATRAGKEEIAWELRGAIAEDSATLKRHRRGLTLADRVEQRAEQMQHTLSTLHKTKEEPDELFVRSSRPDHANLAKRR